MKSIWSIENLVEGTHGKLLQKGTRDLVGVSTDTRMDLKNKIFFALCGDNFDAHKFVQQAADGGCAALIIEQDVEINNKDVTIIKVDATLNALQRFGSWHRKNWHGKMVGLTGSNGKTTTKEFIQTILSQKQPTLATKGNLNNHIGVPLTLLELRDEHKYAVIEMGMNHANEIANLVKIANPEIVLVTNVGTAHMESFVDGVDGIAKAKEEIYEHASPQATRIYNLDNDHTALMRARAPGKCKVMVYSSYARDVDVSLKEKLFTFDFVEVQGVIGGEPGSARIPVFGRQQISNAMAAAAVALAAGIDAPMIWKGLTKCHGSWGRGQMIELQNGAQVLFDAYNANPDSSKMALENFSKIRIKGKKFVVFGDMLELGLESAKMHFEIGGEIAKLNPEAVLLLGARADDVSRGLKEGGFNKKIIKSNTYEEKLAVEFGAMLESQDVALIKGSRGMKLERVVQALQPLNFESKH